MKTRRMWNARVVIMIVVLLCVFQLTGYYANSGVRDQEPQDSAASGRRGPDAVTVHVFYQGFGYFYRGHVVYSLPDGCELIGVVNNVGNTFSGVQMDGNADGCIYMIPEDDSAVYFQWEDWDESVSGREPYLILDWVDTEQEMQ